MNLIDAIYTRQSVDRIDSISVESQVEFCKREVIGENIKVYTDKGYSGKNTDRPAFQEMMTDIEAGKIRRVIVYRLDRISRSVLDFASVIDVFQKHSVDFVSTMEKLRYRNADWKGHANDRDDLRTVGTRDHPAASE